MRTWATTLLAVVIALLVVGASPVAAHVELFESEPEEGGTTDEGTEEISLTFVAFDSTAPVDIKVLDDDEVDRVSGTPRIGAMDRGTELLVPVRPLDLGPHTVEWTAAADDGDGTASGSYDFTVVEPAEQGATWVFAVGALMVIAGVGGALYRLSRRS